MLNSSSVIKRSLIDSLQKAAKQTGLDPLIAYGVLIGSFIYKENAKDIDILIVLQPEIHKDIDIAKRIQLFSIKHAVIQMEHGFTPDWNFPTYCISRQQVDEALHGRPFVIDQSNRITLRQYSPREWIANPESDYNVILFQLISHDFDLFCGSSSALEEDTKKALFIIFLYVYQYFDYGRWKSIDKQILAQDLFRCVGEKYTITSKLQEIFVRDVFVEHQLGSMCGDNILILNHPVIRQALQKLPDTFYKQYTANHICRWQKMRKSVSSLIREEKIIDKIYNRIFCGKNRQEEWENWEMRTKNLLESLRRGNSIPAETSDPEEIRYYGLLHNSIVQLLPKENLYIKKILEVGSGSGTLSLHLSKTFGCESYLIDISPVALEYASFVNQKSRMVLGDATRMPFQSEEFDFLYSVGLIEHFDDKTIFCMLGEMKRVLKRGRFLYLAVPNFFCPDLLLIWYKYGKGAEKYISPSELAKYTQHLGLEVISKGRFPYVHGIFPRYNLENIERVLGKQAFGFLNYVLCRK